MLAVGKPSRFHVLKAGQNPLLVENDECCLRRASCPLVCGEAVAVLCVAGGEQ